MDLPPPPPPSAPLPSASTRRRGPDARFAFRHRLTADSAYAALLRPNRRSLHSAAADALAARIVAGSGSEPALQRGVAFHLREAARHREAQARLAQVAANLANAGASEAELAPTLELAAELWQLARAADPALPPRSAELLLAEGILRRQQGRQAEAEAALGQCIRQAERDGDRGLAAQAHNALGNLHWQRNAMAEAEAAFSAALELARAAGDPTLELPPRFNLARLAYVGGAAAQALAQAEDAIALARSLGNLRVEAFLLNLLAVVYSGLGERARMRECYTQSLALSQATGERVNAATVKSNLGNEALSEGAPEEARLWLEQALADVREMRVPEKLVYALGRLGEAERQLGNLRRAAELLDEAHAAGERHGVKRNIHLVYISQCQVALDRGLAGDARGWLARVEEYVRDNAGWDEGAAAEAQRLRQRLAEVEKASHGA